MLEGWEGDLTSLACRPTLAALWLIGGSDPSLHWGLVAVAIFALVATAALLAFRRQPVPSTPPPPAPELNQQPSQESLQESLDHLRAVVDAAPVLIAQIGPDRRYRFVNAAYEAWFGVPRSQVIGRTMEEVLGPEAMALLRGPFERALIGERVQMERTLPYRHGGHRHVRFVYSPDKRADGSIVGVTSLVVDISELRHQEEVVRQTKAQLEAAFQAIKDGIMVFSMDGFPVQINSAQAHLIGYASPEDLRLHIHEFAQVFELRTSDGEILPEERWPISRVLRGESEPGIELWTRRRDTGQEWVFEFSGEPVRDHEGRQLVGVVITRDITDLKLAERSLRESAEQFRTMANSIPQLAWMAHADGSLFWFNQRWYEYTGTAPEEMRNLGWKKVHHPDHVQRVTDRFQQAMASGEPWEDTFPMRSRTGEWRWFLSRAEPIRDERGRIVRWFGSNTDITEQMKIQRELEESVRNRDEFLSIASHELKTPLTSLVLQTQRLARELRRPDAAAPSPQRVSTYLQAVEKQTNRLSRLVDDMLDITRIKTGQLGLRPERVSLLTVVEDVLERLRATLTRAGVAPTVVLASDAEGLWDRFRLEQVVINLLTNATRYGEGGALEITIERRDGRARLSVRDYGRGLRPEDLERIFGRFERAVSRDEVSGLGLGLFISRQIAEAHGGSLWAESPGPGKGATFILELPLENDSMARAPATL